MSRTQHAWNDSLDITEMKLFDGLILYGITCVYVDLYNTNAPNGLRIALPSTKAHDSFTKTTC